MSGLAPETVAIRRLTIRGRRGAAEHLRDPLAHADWPQADADSWVFIRRLQAQGPARGLPAQLLAQARQYLQQTGSGEEVMRFANLGELLTALLSDIAAGRAAGRWYWRRWAHLFGRPVSQALYSLLSEHWTLLPALTARLADQGGLAAVWVKVDSADGRQLARELAGHLGFNLPEVAAIAAVMAQKLEAARLDLSQASPASAESPLRVSSQLAARWQTALADPDLSDGRCQLALLLIAQQTAPLLLREQPAAVLATLFAVLAGAMPVAGKAGDHWPAKPSLAEAPAVSACQPLPGKASRPDVAIPPDTPRFVGDRIEVAAMHRSRVGANQPNDARRIVLQSAAMPPSRPPAPVVAGGDEHCSRKQPTAFAEHLAGVETGDLAFAGFDTRQGGLLYLLNMLNRSELLDLMQEHAAILPNAWAWLYRLGQELDLADDDSLIDFIALQLGLESRAALGLLPALPARTAVLKLAERWYGKTGVWQPDLLALNARIQFSPSHIDLYAPMSAIRLPVRLAGLDINPGWLPWLGRVVSFHYD